MLLAKLIVFAAAAVVDLTNFRSTTDEMKLSACWVLAICVGVKGVNPLAFSIDVS